MKILTVGMLTNYGPAEVYIDRNVAQQLLPVLEQFLESQKDIIDLVLCERCNVYAAAVHDCEGVQ